MFGEHMYKNVAVFLTHDVRVYLNIRVFVNYRNWTAAKFSWFTL